MPERVIALDPGERTGWASALVSENRISELQHGVLPQKEMAFQLAEWQAVGPIGKDDYPPEASERAFDVIVWETWRPRPKAGSMAWIQGDALLSAQHVGQIRFIGWLSGAKLVGHGPEKKTVALASMTGVLRARMEDCPEQHDADALLHLWLYAWTNWCTTTPDKVVID